MCANHSKSALLYRQVRRALQSGRYLPGQRIDPGTLAEEFNTSPTPVRFALHRLVGERLIDDHARNGLHVPLLAEVALRELYDWMEHLLLRACELGANATEGPPREPVGAALYSHEDLVKGTWQLFDAIAGASGFRPLHDAVRQGNDRLAPARAMEPLVLSDLEEELRGLAEAFDRDGPTLLLQRLEAYHRRRVRRVPQLVEELYRRRT